MDASPIDVLVVEDDEAYSAFLRVLLDRRAGSTARATYVPTLADGLSRVLDGTPDVVLLDLNLPDSLGLSTLERMREAAAITPLVVMSGDGELELDLEAARLGADEFLLKDTITGPQLVRTLRYVTARRQWLRASSWQDEDLRRVVLQNADPMVVINEDGLACFMNPAAERLFPNASRSQAGALLGQAVVGSSPAEIQLLQPRGDHRVMEMRAARISWRGANAQLVSLRDVTERKRSESRLRDLATRLQAANAELTRMATVDPLTELLNRRGLQQGLTREVARADREGGSISAVMLDCDDFKRINEGLGHAAGDVVLRGIGRRLRQATRASDVLGRVGGDEFLLLLPGTGLQEASLVAEKLRLSVAGRPLLHAQGAVHVTISLGVVQLGQNTLSIEEVLSLSRLALKASKADGKNLVTSCSEAGTVSRLKIPMALADIRQVTLPGALRVMWQPIISLKDGTVWGHEMLVRGPRGPLESPEDLFRLAQRSNALVALDLACLRACVEAAEARDYRGRVHINILPTTLLEVPPGDLAAMFKWCLRNAKLSLELSEQQFVGGPEPLLASLDVLRGAGAKLSIDDIGAGYGGLDNVVLLEPDELKLDKRMVQGALTSLRQQRMVLRLVDLARVMDAELVAEGIETVQGMELIRELGVAMAQGYLWSRPVEHPWDEGVVAIPHTPGAPPDPTLN